MFKDLTEYEKKQRKEELKEEVLEFLRNLGATVLIVGSLIALMFI